MANQTTSYNEMVNKIKQMRDEIELKIHLAAADVKDEWDEVEKKFDHVRGRAERVAEAAEDAAENVGEAIELAAAEVRQGYERIKNLL